MDIGLGKAKYLVCGTVNEILESALHKQRRISQFPIQKLSYHRRQCWCDVKVKVVLYFLYQRFNFHRNLERNGSVYHIFGEDYSAVMVDIWGERVKSGGLVGICDSWVQLLARGKVIFVSIQKCHIPRLRGQKPGVPREARTGVRGRPAKWQSEPKPWKALSHQFVRAGIVILEDNPGCG